MRGAVLAGGMASRFGGQPKGLQEVGGERILDRVVNAVQAATNEPPILIANAVDAHEWRPDLHVMRDAIRECGSLGGIYTAVIAAEGPVLVVAWDMPFVPSALLEDLVKGAGEYDAFLPASAEAGRQTEPLCGVYAPSCAKAIRVRIADEDLQASGFYDSIRLGVLPQSAVAQHGEPERLFFNVNTPDDLTKAEELWRSQQA
jgi:molybdopterin-guanine dinucleotide biosynthesis protein A